jgi:hypothetical protein
MTLKNILNSRIILLTIAFVTCSVTKENNNKKPNTNTTIAQVSKVFAYLGTLGLIYASLKEELVVKLIKAVCAYRKEIIDKKAEKAERIIKASADEKIRNYRTEKAEKRFQEGFEKYFLNSGFLATRFNTAFGYRREKILELLREQADNVKQADIVKQDTYLLAA